MKKAELNETVVRLVAENPGVDTVWLVEATGTSVPRVRAAIRETRADFGLDSPRHIVTHRKKHYMPAALHDLGFELSPNKRGISLVATPSNGQSDDQSNEIVPDEDVLEEFRAMFGDRFDHKEVLNRLLTTYMEALTAEAAYKEAVSETKISIAAADAAFRETIEEGRMVDDTQAASVKLHAVEMAWQTLCERKAEAIEARKEALENKKAAESRFMGLIQNVGQLEMVFDADAE